MLDFHSLQFKRRASNCHLGLCPGCNESGMVVLQVKMVVYREEGTQKEEDLYDIITVQLTKKSGKGLGLSIVGRKNGPGVFISDVVSVMLFLVIFVCMHILT